MLVIALHTTIDSDIQAPQRQEEVSELAARMAVRVESIDSDAEDAVENEGLKPAMSIFYQLPVETVELACRVKLSLPLLQWVLVMPVWH